MVMRPIIFAMDANTARTENMRRLVAEAGGPAEWVRRYGGDRWTQPQVSQWISESSPKGIGGRLARDLEQVLGLAMGTLDRPPSLMSQPTRLVPAMLAESIEALRQVFERRGKIYDPVQQPELLVYAYELRLSLGEAPSTGQLIDFGAKLAERIRAKEGYGDGQVPDKQAGGAN